MTADTSGDAELRSGQGFNLALSFTAFTIVFWAWNLIAPLAVRYTEVLSLSPAQKALLVATPVLVGSLGRIVTGALTDRFGGRVMFTVLTAITVVPVLLVAWAGSIRSYPFLLVAALLLGIAGTMFAVGIPFVSAWYEPSRRGFATGVFGSGMVGTAFSSFFTPRFVTWFGYLATHLILAGILVVTTLVVWFWLRDAPGWRPNTDPVMPKLAAASRLPITWQMSFLYAVSFGGFVAFSTYLPTYLNDVYEFDLTGAGTRTAGFALAAVLARPLGGALADRIGAPKVLVMSLSASAVLAIAVALQPPPELAAGITFVLMAVALGVGAAGVFTWIANRTPSERIGSVSGIVGAAGGLGGYFPPLVMGATYNAEERSYTIGLLLLCATLVVALVCTIVWGRRDVVRSAASVEQQPR